MIGWLPQEIILPYNTVLEMFEEPYKYRANRNKKFNRHAYEEAVQKLGLPTSILDEPLQKYPVASDRGCLLSLLYCKGGRYS